MIGLSIDMRLRDVRLRYVRLRDFPGLPTFAAAAA